MVDFGYDCSGEIGSSSYCVKLQICGDGIVDIGVQCDNRNKTTIFVVQCFHLWIQLHLLPHLQYYQHHLQVSAGMVKPKQHNNVMMDFHYEMMMVVINFVEYNQDGYATM